MGMSEIMSEVEYRKLIQESMDKIDEALADVDPDLAECDQANGAMSIVFQDRSRCILSAQPSVRQLWLALAGVGTAYHFNYDLSRHCWMDDKGQGVELLAFMRDFLQKKTGLTLKL
jgi:CyaY protein